MKRILFTAIICLHGCLTTIYGQDSSRSTDIYQDRFLPKWCLWLRHGDGRMEHKYLGWHGNKTIGDKSYHAIIDLYMEGQDLLCRFDDDKLYRYDDAEKEEFVLCDFNLSRGDEFNTKDGRTMRIEETSNMEITGYNDKNYSFGTYKTLDLVNVENPKETDRWLEGFGSLSTSILMKSELGDDVEECCLLWCEGVPLYNLYDTECLKTQLMHVDKTDDSVVETEFGTVVGPDSLQFEFDGNTLVVSGAAALTCSFIHYMSCEIEKDVISFRIDDIGCEECNSRHFFTARFPGFKEGRYVIRYEGMYRNVIEANVVCGENHAVVGMDSVEQGKKVIGVPSYDISGRRLTSEPEHGIYIKDGKKHFKL